MLLDDTVYKTHSHHQLLLKKEETWTQRHGECWVLLCKLRLPSPALEGHMLGIF